MKIELFIVENINEQCSGMTCFHAPEHIAKAISRQKAFVGIVLINNEAVKFNFSCLGMDGDIFSDNEAHREIVKRIVPLYVYNDIQYKMSADINEL
jgi:hypothetical protein